MYKSFKSIVEKWSKRFGYEIVHTYYVTNPYDGSSVAWFSIKEFSISWRELKILESEINKINLSIENINPLVDDDKYEGVLECQGISIWMS